MTTITQAPVPPRAAAAAPLAAAPAQQPPAAAAPQAAPAPQVTRDAAPAANLTIAAPQAADIDNVNLDATELRALDNLLQTYLADGQLSASEQKVYQEVRGLFARDGAAAPAPGTPAPATPAPEGAGPTPPEPAGGAGPVTPEKPAFDPNPTWRELVATLERELGPGEAVDKGGRWAQKVARLSDPPREFPRIRGFQSSGGGSGKQVGDSDASSTMFWGPNTSRHLREAYEKLQSGDISGAKQSYATGVSTRSPVMLDLNGDGKLGTTGVSTAKARIDGQVGQTVSFDLDGDGVKEQTEWMDGQGDGMLVDDRDGAVTRAAAGNGEIDGTRLFGDQGGKFDHGYAKLAGHDANQDGKLTGAELEGLKTWIDDGDARVEAGELKSLAELGITELATGMTLERNARGEDLMRSTFVQDGQTRVTEDVWFATA